MRLFIILDDKSMPIILTKESDVLLTNNYKYYNESRVVCESYFVNYSLEDENPVVAESINEFFGRLPNEYSEYSNIWYTRFFKPIFSIIKQIDNIIVDKNINEIVLSDGSEHIFVAINSAEGEGRKILYKSSWLINPILFKYYKNDKDIKITWNSKKKKSLLKFINYLRETVQIYAIAFIKIIKSTKFTSKNYFQENRLNQNKNTIIIANLPLQLRHFKVMMKSKKHINTNYIVPSNIKLEQKEEHIKSSPLKTSSILKKLLNCKNDLIRYKNVFFYINGLKIEISSKSFERTARIIRFQTDCKVSELINTIEKLYLSKCDYILTNMTYGREIIEVRRVARYLGIKHINVQYVAMSKIILPNMELADVYYLYSKKTYELYSKYSNTYRYFLPIIMKPEVHRKKTNKIKIIVFTQPDSYTDRYIDFLGGLLAALDSAELNVDINIKPHYRQDKMDEFARIASKFSFTRICNKDENANDLILESDIIVSMTSSVLFEALMLGKMGIIVGIDSTLIPIIYDNDICFPEVNFVIKNIQEFISIINNFESYSSKYIARYHKFINREEGIGEFDELF